MKQNQIFQPKHTSEILLPPLPKNMHTSTKPLSLFYITFFLGISSFLYTAEARLLPGCTVEVVCKESMVMRSYQGRYSPPPPPKTSPPSPEMRTPPTALSSMKPLLSAQVASS